MTAVHRPRVCAAAGSQVQARGRAPAWCRALAAKRLLVTGAAGFIGGALYRLRDYGFDVIGTVQYPADAGALRT